MRKYVLLASVLAAVGACGQPCEIVPALGSSDTTSVVGDTSILPLEVGNEWTYVNPHMDTMVMSVISITGKVTQEDSLVYYKVEEKERGNRTLRIRMLRWRNPGELEDYAGGKRRIYITLQDSTAKTLDDWWDQGYTPRWSRQENVETLAGLFPGCDVVQFGIMEYWWQYYYRGQGKNC